MHPASLDLETPAIGRTTSAQLYVINAIVAAYLVAHMSDTESIALAHRHLEGLVLRGLTFTEQEWMTVLHHRDQHGHPVPTLKQLQTRFRDRLVELKPAMAAA